MATQMGMGFTTENITHVGVLAECNEAVLAAHLIFDHNLPAEGMAKEQLQTGTLIMLHMQLHGEVVEVDLEEE